MTKSTAKKYTPYPWKNWFSRKRKFRLCRKVDFGCGSHVMAQQIRNRAVKEKRKVSISLQENTIIVEMRGKAK